MNRKPGPPKKDESEKKAPQMLRIYPKDKNAILNKYKSVQEFFNTMVKSFRRGENGD